MAVIEMQKVAVVAHRSEQQAVLELLHREGVMEVANMRDVVSVDHASVPYRAAELDHVIMRLKEYATPETLAELEKKVSSKVVVETALKEDIRRLIDRVHALEEVDGNLRQALQQVEHGHLGKGLKAGMVAAEEGVYLAASKVKEDLSHFGSVDDSGVRSTPEVIAAERARIEASLEANRAEWMLLSVQLPTLVRARLYVHWLDERHAVEKSMQHTRSTVTLFGWIAKHLFDSLERKLHKVSPATAVVAVEPGPDEKAPVLLKNPAWLKPFESVTTLYGLPQAHEFDPTPLLAPFFILFFGLCLTDAGYGLVLAAAMAGFLWKKKQGVNEAPLWWLLMIGGLMTFLISIPFGGWFGMSPDQAPAFMVETRADGQLWFKGQIWNLGATPGITFFQNLSLALGVIHIAFGVFLAGLGKWMKRQYAEAFWVDWTTLILMGAAVAYFFVDPSLQSLVGKIVLGSVALVWWGKGYGSKLLMRPLNGFLGILNLAMGMMSNILSYLRLLALGLVTGALALAVNLVAQQIGAMLPAPVGIPVSIVIYLAGHTVNIALNVLGAFIHSGRLQFVEFFSQFFEGGGRPFAPFKQSHSA